MALALGRSMACSLGSLERVYCWGSNFFGQLGTGEGQPISAVPVLVVPSVSDAVNLGLP